MTRLPLRKKTSLLLATALLATTLLWAAEGRAFSCKRPSFEKAFENSVTVFLGRVIEKVALSPNPEAPDVIVEVVTFAPSHLWKGKEKEKLQILSDRMPNFFGIDYELNENYLVFAEYDESKHIFYVSACGLNKPVKVACDLIRKLNELSPNKGRSCGN